MVDADDCLGGQFLWSNFRGFEQVQEAEVRFYSTADEGLGKGRKAEEKTRQKEKTKQESVNSSGGPHVSPGATTQKN